MRVSTWGSKKIQLGTINVRGVGIQAACDSIARRTKLSVISRRHDGFSLGADGMPESAHYEITLGYALRSGGYSLEARIWVAIPVVYP